MPRPSQAAQKRAEHIATVARAFADLGYRRTTTAELASRCALPENVLYRLWPDKKSMFIAAIDHVYARAAMVWQRLLDKHVSGSRAEALLKYEAEHLGELGFARIVFAGLSETDDPDIRGALSRMYLGYQQFVEDQVRAHRNGAAGQSGKGGARKGTRSETRIDPALAAWALIGIGTVGNIARELTLLNGKERSRLVTLAGTALLG